ncbi:Ribonuclease 3 [Candidatus Filomicrobium marinum]|uniref:Ribonuclease 3 n=3 Tax=Filomicrobium TaxID=119044 RepID=A0A0D6JIL3_9HYPH|nr:MULTISPECIES: ribonuclease III [Filomicrobium]CFX42259.1 Ribonuclease 3 [Candidatus Filomicrobium marinum]CPR21101.1 Ribonuclease 3 [Candidatus Filomicrobium marinum]SDP23624.1 ribonuclease-3 [Filomicrobium insigne]
MLAYLTGRMIKKNKDLKALETALGYKFKSHDLLRCALTHSSARSVDADTDDNERLEFIGDRVLGLVMAELLGETMPTAREGDLARRFNQLVRRETCATVARQINLGRYLILSPSESDNGGRDKDTILADAMEALLAAIFLDGGFPKARATVRSLWEPQCRQPSCSDQDAKSALQEWAQGRGMPLPRYVEISRTGPDHAPVFIAEVQIDGTEPGRGEGPSKRAAEQAAASSVLQREGVRRVTNDNA